MILGRLPELPASGEGEGLAGGKVGPGEDTDEGVGDEICSVVVGGNFFIWSLWP
jgi:hypothetical protein